MYIQVYTSIYKYIRYDHSVYNIYFKINNLIFKINMPKAILPLSRQERDFELTNYGLSIPVDYTGADPFGFKPGSYHNNHLKSKNSKVRRVGHNV